MAKPRAAAAKEEIAVSRARKARHRGFLLLGAFVFVGLPAFGLWLTNAPLSSTKLSEVSDPGTLAAGKRIYDTHCASCHGKDLEGEPNWRERKPSGRMPAPPHDDRGHTWHHPDAVLFGITKEGLVPGKYGPPGYASDMPAFGASLTDGEIWAVLAYIASRWSVPQRTHQAKTTRSASR